MDRRRFVGSSAVGLAGSLIAGCAPGFARTSDTDVRPTREMDAFAFHAARRNVLTDFGRVAYVEKGSGPAALFLHGFPLNGFQWRGALHRLASYRRCIAPDFLGLGYTQVAPGASVAPPAQVAMLVQLLDALEVDTVDLIANDSGGAIAQLFATQHGARVRSLLLTNCDVETDSPPPAVVPAIEAAREGKFADTWLAPWVADKELARSAQGLGGLTFTDPAKLRDETIDYYLAPLVASPKRKALTNAYAMGLDPNPLAGIEGALRRCTVPTRIVWGTGDEIFKQSSADYLAGVMGRSRGVRRVPGAKLFFPEEYPDLIAEELRTLWEV